MEPSRLPGIPSAGSGHLSATDVETYSRQLLLPSFGVEGQCHLKNSSVLIVGVGGLGCPAALYLAGAGVGVLGLVDRPGDVVERSNLHRQIAHARDRAGVGKVESAATAIKALNPDVKIVRHKEIVPANAVKLVSSYTVVLDCTDNVRSRYLINDACAAARVPLVFGSALGMDGQLTVYGLNESAPCYRCIFPQPPPPQCVGSCDAAGVLGPIPGTIGTLQAVEALKIASRMKNCTTLSGRLLLFDGANAEFRTVTLRKKAVACLACGDSCRINVSEFDYEAFCHLTYQNALARDEDEFSLPEKFRISVQEFAKMRLDASKGKGSYLLLDVRPQSQFNMCALEESRNLPVANINDQAIESLRKVTHQIVLCCRRGNSSQQAGRLLLKNGISNIVDIRGGLQAWHHEVDKSFPLY